MKINIELPQPVKLNQDDTIELYLPDSGGAFITMHGDGTVSYKGNGHNAPEYSLNLVAVAHNIRADLH